MLEIIKKKASLLLNHFGFGVRVFCFVQEIKKGEYPYIFHFFPKGKAFWQKQAFMQRTLSRIWELVRICKSLHYIPQKLTRPVLPHFAQQWLISVIQKILNQLNKKIKKWEIENPNRRHWVNSASMSHMGLLSRITWSSKDKLTQTHKCCLGCEIPLLFAERLRLLPPVSKVYKNVKLIQEGFSIWANY